MLAIISLLALESIFQDLLVVLDRRNVYLELVNNDCKSHSACR